MDLRSFIAGMPKAENHVHLDGSTTPQSALELAARNHVELPFRTPEEAEKLYQYGSLDDFLRIINAVCQVIRTREDFAYLTLKMAEDAKAQNILYREVMLSCYYHEQRGIPFETQIEGFIEGRRLARERFGVELSAIPEIDRTMPPEESRAFVDRLIPYREEADIVAVGLDSAEAGFPAHWHAAAFERAAELGFGLTAHAGEAYGPVSIQDSLDSIHCRRIDHGVRAVEDPELVERLARERILLTVCPWSNVALQVFPDMAHHSFGRLYRAGVPVSVNSDDPAFFGKNLNDNYEAVVETFRLEPPQLLEIAKNAFSGSYAPRSLVKQGIAGLERYFQEHTYEL